MQVQHWKPSRRAIAYAAISLGFLLCTADFPVLHGSPPAWEPYYDEEAHDWYAAPLPIVVECCSQNHQLSEAELYAFNKAVLEGAAGPDFLTEVAARIHEHRRSRGFTHAD